MRTKEIWKEVPYAPGYFVSNTDKIRHNGKLLAPKPRHTGYIRVCLTVDQRPLHKYRHVVILESFHPKPCPEMEVRHLDSNPSNCKLSNLAWGTKQDNGKDRAALGRMKGERHPNAKLKTADVKKIKGMIKREIPVVKIALRYDVRPCTIHYIKQGRTWTHIAA